MSNSKKTIQNSSRRNFLYQSSLASLGLVFMGKNSFAGNSIFLGNLNSKIKGVQIGAITYSFRSMPGSAEQLIQYLKEAGISAIELMGDPAEAYAGSPVGEMTNITRENYMKTMEERNAKARVWRETASMDKFV
ncbi:MAG: sugar phosphate isomerase/epimerase, partial [Chitinophagia bacterium]